MTEAAEHPSLRVVAFPTSQPASETVAHIEFGACIDDVPTWSIATLNAGPPRSSSNYAQHLQNTVGSSYDWSDEFRFDKRTGRLTSFVLKTPETGVLDSRVAISWLALPPQIGIPALADREKGFHVDPLDLRYVSHDTSSLVVADARMQAPDSSSLRISIARDTDLLFQHGRYSGWILRNPVAHLVSDPADTAPGTDDVRLHSLLREYLALVIEPNITRMNDEDPALRAALEALGTRITEVDAVQARALADIVEKTLEAFYPR